MRVNVVFGALAPPLWKQLRLPMSRVRFVQKAADAITRLAVNQFLSESEAHRARRRLMKRILQTFGKELAERG